MLKLPVRLLVAVAFCTSIYATSPGTVVLAGDEWEFLNEGIAAQPASSMQLIRNLTGMFGGPGKVLGYGTNPCLTGTSLAAEMQVAGNSYTVSSSIPFTLESLL